MRTSNNTQSPHAHQVPPPPAPTSNCSWADYLDRTASSIEYYNAGDERAWFVAAIIRDAATTAHLHGLQSHTEHYQFLMELEEDPALTSAPDYDGHGSLAGSDAQWELNGGAHQEVE